MQTEAERRFRQMQIEMGRRIERFTRAIDSAYSTTTTKMQDLIQFTAASSEILRELTNAPNEIAKAIERDFGGLISQFEVVRTTYGDLKKLEGDRVTAAGAAFRRIDKLTRAMYMKQTEVDGVIMSTEDLFEKRLGAHTNYLLKNFEQEEAVRLVEAAQGDLNVQYARQINAMDDIVTLKIPAYTKGMMISSQRISDMMRIQILRTGQANTDLLDQVAAYSREVSRKTGIPVAALNERITDIISNIKLYGDVQADEATRIAGNITQLGLKYEALSETQQKFGKFSGAADNIGKISQITGVQLDAQRIAFLSATGKMDEALIYMKDQFKRQGFTKEDFQGMTLPLRNALSDAMIGGQEGVMNLLDMSKPFEDIEEITKRTDISKGFSTVTDNLDRLAGYNKNPDQIAKEIRMQAIIPLGRDAHNTAQQISLINQEFQKMDLPGQKEAIGAQSVFLRGSRELYGAVEEAVEFMQTNPMQVDFSEEDKLFMGELYTADMARHYTIGGNLPYQNLDAGGNPIPFEAVIPEDQLARTGAYISNSTLSTLQPVHDQMVTLHTNSTDAAVQQNIINGKIQTILDEQAVYIKEGHKLKLQIELRDTNGVLLKTEEINAVKDDLNRYVDLKIDGVVQRRFGTNNLKP